MSNLILVKHSQPQQDSNLPASEWRLSEEGRLRCQALAEKLATFQPDRIISSQEPKAVETAQLVAGYLNKPCESAEGLHEHNRSNTGYLSAGEFQSRVQAFFAQPDKLVMGLETAAEARIRFENAVKALLEKYPGENLGVVAHGTVITLLVAAYNSIEPYSFWQGLGLPSIVVLSRPGLLLQETVNIETR